MSATLFQFVSTYQDLRGTLRIDHTIKGLGGAALFVPHPLLSQLPAVVKMPPSAKSTIDFNSHVLPLNFVGNILTPPKIFWWPTTSNVGDVVFGVSITTFRVDSASIDSVATSLSPVAVPSGKEAQGVVTVPSGLTTVPGNGDPNTMYLVGISREGADAGDTYPDDILIGHAFTDLVIP